MRLRVGALVRYELRARNTFLSGPAQGPLLAERSRSEHTDYKCLSRSVIVASGGAGNIAAGPCLRLGTFFRVLACNTRERGYLAGGVIGAHSQRDHAHGPAAPWVKKRIDLVDLEDQLCPSGLRSLTRNPESADGFKRTMEHCARVHFAPA